MKESLLKHEGMKGVDSKGISPLIMVICSGSGCPPGPLAGQSIDIPLYIPAPASHKVNLRFHAQLSSVFSA